FIFILFTSRRRHTRSKRDLRSDVCSSDLESICSLTSGFPIPEAHIYVELGSIEKSVHEKAAELKADIIVMGSHMRGGWGILLGSTARGMLPGSQCDVLAVKIED